MDKEGLVWVTELWEEGKVVGEGWMLDKNEKGENILKRTWDEFKDSTEFKDKVSKHKEIKNDVLLATRNFQHRVKCLERRLYSGIITQ